MELYVIAFELNGRIVEVARKTIPRGHETFDEYIMVFKYKGSAEKIDIGPKKQENAGAKLKVMNIKDVDIDLRKDIMNEIKYIPLMIQHTTYLSFTDIEDTYDRAKPLVSKLFYLVRDGHTNKEKYNKILNEVYMNFRMADSQRYIKDRTVFEKKIEAMEKAIQKLEDLNMKTFGVGVE